MSSGKRYTEEFKKEAVKQITERGYSVAEVAERLGTTTHSLYAWLKRYGEQNPRQANKLDEQAEIAQLKAELRRVTEERDILKKAAKYFAENPE
jgi:transposase